MRSPSAQQRSLSGLQNADIGRPESQSPIGLPLPRDDARYSNTTSLTLDTRSISSPESAARRSANVAGLTICTMGSSAGPVLVFPRDIEITPEKWDGSDALISNSHRLILPYSLSSRGAQPFFAASHKTDIKRSYRSANSLRISSRRDSGLNTGIEPLWAKVLVCCSERDGGTGLTPPVESPLVWPPVCTRFTSDFD